MKLTSAEMERFRQDIDLTSIERLSRMTLMELKRFNSMQDSHIESQQRQFDEFAASLPTEHEREVAKAALKERIYQVTLHTTQNLQIYNNLNKSLIPIENLTETQSTRTAPIEKEASMMCAA